MATELPTTGTYNSLAIAQDVDIIVFMVNFLFIE